MKNTATKKLVVAFAVMAMVIGFQLVLADGQGTPSPYHNPTDTGINLDTSLVLGAGMYGAGILLTSASKAIQAKFTKGLVN
ncbi:MAG: hypothetical protein ACOYT9_01015 [Patescibacteria group bacterium]|jgi:hypothetical protein